MKPFRERHLLHACCAVYLLVWIWSAIAPLSRSDWFLENILVFLFVPLLVWHYRRFALSNASWLLVCAFLSLHTLGAHYTYARTPLGFQLGEWFGWPRNHFDRIVHFCFGLLLTYPAQEVLARLLRPRGAWAAWLAIGLIASASGLFEIIEAIVAWIVSPQLGSDYLGTQGDVWDAQKDMALAIIGACLAVLAARFIRGKSPQPSQVIY